MNEVAVTSTAVAGGVLPNQLVVPFSSVKEYPSAPDVAGNTLMNWVEINEIVSEPTVAPTTGEAPLVTA